MGEPRPCHQARRDRGLILLLSPPFASRPSVRPFFANCNVLRSVLADGGVLREGSTNFGVATSVTGGDARGTLGAPLLPAATVAGEGRGGREVDCPCAPSGMAELLDQLEPEGVDDGTGSLMAFNLRLLTFVALRWSPRFKITPASVPATTPWSARLALLTIPCGHTTYLPAHLQRIKTSCSASGA